VKSTSAELRQMLDAFRGTRIALVGDLILDTYVWGVADRVSQEAPVLVVEVREEEHRPGGAANVAKNLISLGAEVSVFGVIGDDISGRELVSLLSSQGVDVRGVLVDEDRPTSVKTRVIAHSQQVVRIDREKRGHISGHYSRALVEQVATKAAESGAIVVSDYGKGVVSDILCEELARGIDRGLLGAPKCPVIIDPKPANFHLYRRATVVKPNRAEAQQASGIVISSRTDAVEAAKILLNRWGADIVLITLGDQGMVLVSDEGDRGAEVVEIDTVARDVYDVSGAGDTVSAVFSLGLACGFSPARSAEMANIAAGVVVGEVGTVAVTAEQLDGAIEEYCQREG
jgi:D-beta-D-heptose 7-phosphate kinase/D-beta-D-heptose 1-phosphate adenosyltransferase